MGKVPKVCSQFHVSDFLTNGTWNLHALKRWVEPHLIKQILQCSVETETSHNDRLIWDPGKEQPFSVASAYKSLLKNTTISTKLHSTSGNYKHQQK